MEPGETGKGLDDPIMHSGNSPKRVWEPEVLFLFPGCCIQVDGLMNKASALKFISSLCCSTLYFALVYEGNLHQIRTPELIPFTKIGTKTAIPE